MFATICCQTLETGTLANIGALDTNWNIKVLARIGRGRNGCLDWKSDEMCDAAICLQLLETGTLANIGLMDTYKMVRIVRGRNLDWKTDKMCDAAICLRGSDTGTLANIGPLDSNLNIGVRCYLILSEPWPVWIVRGRNLDWKTNKMCDAAICLRALETGTLATIGGLANIGALDSNKTPIRISEA